ncbi:hypothetical protein NNJEOMEG_03128 [Fundidesulfovibrio magnetotacticus]|uniref:Uncharacterized protein n=1 Tax=Fundidesulfovibrio magnetotacticus TaxID=2730080 RepID=A0A6V8LZ25_9BACT|nr:hypothetical protein [Fundidesulfovibrio magnetotacticus]GFK95269.1 hypothetical protein NNJEOMEG_03128 [Fundidesulfovibrio magnetotacticus]
MRAFNESEQAILRVVEAFDGVVKYLGITPEEHLVSYSQKHLERLLDEEILERAKLRFFSGKIKGVRFTRDGLAIWRLFTGQETPEAKLPDAGLLVRDLYLRNGLSSTDEATPRDTLLKHHSRRALVDAFQAGLVAKVKIRHPGGEKTKGFVVTHAGYAWLRGNSLI